MVIPATGSNSGPYQYEIAWNIEDSEGNIIFSAGTDGKNLLMILIILE